MIYKGYRETKILKTGEYEGYNYVIVSCGLYPYVIIDNIDYDRIFPGDKKENKNFPVKLNFNLNNRDINLKQSSPNDYYITWEYNKFNDYSGEFINNSNPIFSNKKKWTIEEIKEDIFNIINQMREIPEELIPEND